ncbi:MAG: transcriptional regulator [Flavobacteriales bacterium CG18_big_fil_WC_8_21_14_2_50_32_9]|nr:MAG: transcriptional regulator [Flavobacteriales bacterium CG18_big_fil_WC_8_21_14_2_50_32_9]PIZ06171.1 MAG: transcriptional regulator [Flavobacteriales bacterium CG_4_10_14_0_8_um_filter_32_5]
MGFGERLKELRETKGISKTDLANKISLHYSQIGRYERNEANPSADMLKKLANELDVTTDYLMNGTTNDLADELINDKTLINQFKKIAQLSDENKKVVVSLIDAFIFKQETKQRLSI